MPVRLLVSFRVRYGYFTTKILYHIHKEQNPRPSPLYQNDINIFFVFFIRKTIYSFLYFIIYFFRHNQFPFVTIIIQFSRQPYNEKIILRSLLSHFLSHPLLAVGQHKSGQRLEMMCGGSLAITPVGSGGTMVSIIIPDSAAK